MHRYKLPLILLLFVLLAIAWITAPRHPDEDEVMRQATAALQQRYGHLASIEPLQLVDDSGDKETYVAEVRFRLTFNQGLGELLEQARQRAQVSFNYAARQAAEAELAEMQKKFGEFKPGETVEYQERFSFVAADAGWQLQP